MVRQTNPTGAESCWEDEPESEAECEKYLHAQSVNSRRDPIADDDDEEEENDDADEADTDEDEQDSVAEQTPVTAEDDSDAGDDEDEENDEPADKESAQLKGKKMAKAKTGKTKAESIREVIAARQEAGKDLRPRDIIETLTKKGIEVNASQVSITLRAMGVPAMKRGAAVSKPVAAKPETNGEELKSRVTAKVRAPVAAADVAVSVDAMDNLLGHAADFIHEAGGIDRARSVLEMCHKVMQRT
jgi:arginine repressor